MKEKDNKSFWQRFAKLYPKFMERNLELYDGLCKDISKKLHPEMRVLELACGTGQLSFPLAPFVKSYVATDFSEAMINEAKKLKAPDNLEFFVEDAGKLSYSDDSFDAVIISNALHIMPQPEKALSEIKRVLKKDGVLFAPTFTNGSGMLFKLRTSVMSLAGFKVFHKWDDRELAEFLEKNGFAVKVSNMRGNKMFPLCYIEAEKAQKASEA